MPPLPLGEIAQTVLSAPLSVTGWDDALKAIATATRSTSGHIIGIGATRTLAFNLITNPAEPDILRQFDTEVADYSDGNWRVAATAGPFDLRHEYHYAQIRTTARTDVYDHFAFGADIPYGCQTVLLNQSGLLIGLAVLRSQSDEPTTEDDRAIFGQLAPYALAAARLQRSLEEEGAQLMSGSLDAMSAIAFICDAQGRIQAKTRSADALLSDGGLVTLRDGLLALPSPTEHRELRRIMATMLGRDEPSMPTRAFWLGMDRPMRERRLCELFILPRKNFSFGFEPRLLITIRQAGDLAACERQLLSSLMGLTSAEAEIAMMLADGIPREATAQQRGTSLGTVSVQIKRLFEKAETNREAEFVALLNRLLR